MFLPQISSFDQKSDWFWCSLLDYTKLCKLTIIYSPPDFQITSKWPKNDNFLQKNTIFCIKNVCYCPKFTAVTKNPVDFYVFCWITQNYAKYLYFLILLRSKLDPKWPKMTVFSKKMCVFFLRGVPHDLQWQNQFFS